jgi:translation initiation factor 3 subunit F
MRKAYPPQYLVHLLSTAAASETHTTSTLTDLQKLGSSLHEVLSMIDRVQAYIQSVLAGETEGDVSVGRYLLETLSTATNGLESGRLESLFSSHLQVRGGFFKFWG